MLKNLSFRFDDIILRRLFMTKILDDRMQTASEEKEEKEWPIICIIRLYTAWAENESAIADRYFT